MEGMVSETCCDTDWPVGNQNVILFVFDDHILCILPICVEMLGEHSAAAATYAAQSNIYVTEDRNDVILKIKILTTLCVSFSISIDDSLFPEVHSSLLPDVVL